MKLRQPIECIDPSYSLWDQFVRDAPDGTIYHSPAWSGIIARSYGFRPAHLTVENSDGALTGVLPLFLVSSPFTGRRLVSLPCTNAAGPLSHSEEDTSRLLAAAVELARRERCRYLEVRGQPGQQLAGPPEMQPLDYYGSFLLELATDAERVRAGFDKRARRGIAKAGKSGVRTRFGGDLAAVREFHKLNLITRRKHGVPPQPFAFFEALWATLRPAGAVEVLLAEREGVTIAAIMLLAFKDTVIYAYGASDQRELRHAPNHALFDAAIGWAVDQGYRFFDFGRTAPDNAGLMDFKRQWGATFVPLPYFYWPARGGFVAEAEAGAKHRLFTAVWRRLPLAATALLGPRLYRHLA